MPYVPLNDSDASLLVKSLIDDGLLVDESSAKGRLLKASAELFKSKGYDKTTVRDIANQVGIQSGSIFHHYASKQAILCAVMEQAIILNMARLRLALSLNETLKEQLHALILSELQAIILDNGIAMAVLVYEWRSLENENKQKILELRDEYEQIWLDILTQAHHQQLINTTPMVLRKLLTGAISWTTNWYKPHGELSIDELAEMTLALAINNNLKN
ncbi:TetR/AcrR family transcriptional regulator [Psychrobium sp. 1_MG-2023]|uniref:TetR/AcrR family transcriptional regulator n=1 Tax=Psychrobium sp. 1_MG-2023 TaxID=3062624 RepID=UPI000C336632|nr:TetR/AcrR family transcriptional regulator [Psychrobium sp. 1_MG-2023]MDP2560657.1 TetR/AcrR family transcriptional regulator [Psychrobium sp. 1_MG-2023]PKF56553.1 TetR family transcriptional regulator [Alteromonadales bacterium alter-6D02]